MSENNKKNHKGAWMAVLCVALIACIACVGYIGWYLWNQEKSQSEYDDIKGAVKSTETQTETQSESKVTLDEVLAAEFNGWTDGEEPKLPEDVKTELPDNPIDFKKLQEINSEIYAWVEVPGTKIDYPVAQHQGDDSFYLSHNMYQEPEFAGCIYTEEANSKDFSDPNTVIYGHNMRNGSMFQNLHLFEAQDFFDEHQNVYVYTPQHKLTYQIFAAYEYDDRHILNSFDFKDEIAFGEYLQEVFSIRSMNANIRSDIKVTAENQILTLSTCVGGKPNARYLVQAVLQNDEETK